jgi:nucleoside-diphosphate-sugar epimerase
MQVLVTGHRGSIGATVTEHLRRRGYAIRGFDVADGDDLLDLDALRRAAGECAAIVHLGALPRDTAGPPEKIMAVNVLGTWHAPLAAEEARASRVVHFSSAQVFGFAEGEGSPDYFPVDDHHPRRAKRPYGLSKRLAEDLCQAFSERTGVPSVCLRPVWVCHPEDYKRVEEQRRADPSSEWEPYWARGGFVDVCDVADAVARALEVPLEGHHRAVLCAADIAGSAPSLELAARLAPGVPVRDATAYSADPWRALFDCAVAQKLLGWRPLHRWSDHRYANGPRTTA